MSSRPESLNFGFLARSFPFLASTAAFAERYARSNPVASLGQVRIVVEGLVREVGTHRFRVQLPARADLQEWIEALQARRFLTVDVERKLQRVRLLGNRGSHYELDRRPPTERDALDALREAFDVARWFVRQLDASVRLPERFREPQAEPDAQGVLEQLQAAQAELEQARERLAAYRAAPLSPSDEDALRRAAATAQAELGLDAAAASAWLASLPRLALARSYAEARLALAGEAGAELDGLQARLEHGSGDLALDVPEGWADPHMRLVAGRAVALVVWLVPGSGRVLLLWAGPRPDAEAWGRARRLEVNPRTGCFQEVVDVSPGSVPTAGDRGLLEGVPQDALLELGVPQQLVGLVRALPTERALSEVLPVLPDEAAEGLLRLATGEALEVVLRDARDTRPARVLSTTDIDVALTHPDSRRRFFAPETRDELADALAQPLEAWRLFLHPSQARLVRQHFNGPARVIGGAGTGKTVVAMHRVRALAERLGDDPQARVLLTTFSRSLAENLRPMVASLCGALAARVEVRNVDSWAARFLRHCGREIDVADDGDVDRAWVRALRAAPGAGRRSRGFYEAEHAWATAQMGVRDRDGYLSARRKGRGRLTRREQVEAWAVFTAFRDALQGKLLWSDVHRLARDEVERLPAHPYRAVVVDEAQDMTGEQLRLIRALVAPGPDDVFLAGDAHQRIYREPLPVSACGLRIVGRSRRLTVNYRTTEAIRRFAVRLVEGLAFDDLDGADASTEGAVSLRSGLAPRLRGFATRGEEVAFVADEVRRAAATVLPDAICVVARRRATLQAFAEAIEAAGTKTLALDRQDEDRGDGVRLATMHRVKGLEFLHVFVVAACADEVPLASLLERADEGQREAIERQERSLLYVATSRPRERLTITWHGAPSPYLPEGA